MARFSEHIGPLIAKEGGYTLTDTAEDRGGKTYAGISERANPDWPGWGIIDAQGIESPGVRDAVHARYRENYWTPIKGDEISSSKVAEVLFSSAVLSGPRTAVRLAQTACGVRADGMMGPVTLKRLNAAARVSFWLTWVWHALPDSLALSRRIKARTGFSVDG